MVGSWSATRLKVSREYRRERCPPLLYRGSDGSLGDGEGERGGDPRIRHQRSSMNSNHGSSADRRSPINERAASSRENNRCIKRNNGSEQGHRRINHRERRQVATTLVPAAHASTTNDATVSSSQVDQTSVRGLQMRPGLPVLPWLGLSRPAGLKIDMCASHQS